jgi:hypothetical protein
MPYFGSEKAHHRSQLETSEWKGKVVGSEATRESANIVHTTTRSLFWGIQTDVVVGQFSTKRSSYRAENRAIEWRN